MNKTELIKTLIAIAMLAAILHNSWHIWQHEKIHVHDGAVTKEVFEEFRKTYVREQTAQWERIREMLSDS